MQGPCASSGPLGRVAAAGSLAGAPQPRRAVSWRRRLRATHHAAALSSCLLAQLASLLRCLFSKQAGKRLESRHELWRVMLPRLKRAWGSGASFCNTSPSQQAPLVVLLLFLWHYTPSSRQMPKKFVGNKLKIVELSESLANPAAARQIKAKYLPVSRVHMQCQSGTQAVKFPFPQLTCPTCELLRNQARFLLLRTVRLCPEQPEVPPFQGTRRHQTEGGGHN